MMDTQRSVMSSAIKGINSGVRKIQTPQVFKGKQKPTKRSSNIHSNINPVNNTTTNVMFYNPDFNPFQQSARKVIVNNT